MSAADTTQDVGRDRTARGLTVSTMISLGLRLVGIAIGMVTTSLLARALAPAGYGALSLATTLVTAAAQTADLGIAITVASRIARESAASAGRVLSTGLVIRTSTAIVAMVGLVAAALAGVFGDAGGVVAIAAVATPLSAASVMTAGSTARFRPEVSSVLLLVQGVLWFVAVLVVDRTGAAIHVLVWCFVGVTLLQTGVGVALNRKVVPLRRPSWLEARRIIAASWPLAISSFAFTAYYRLDSVILFNAKGATELGFYAAAYKFIDVAQLAPTILVAPLLPIAANSLTMDRARRSVVLSLATRTAAAIGTGTAVLLIALAPQLIGILFGDGFGPAVRPLTLLAIAFMAIPLGFVGTTICSALGLVRPIAVLTVVVAVASLTAQAWVCPRWGASGAATVTVGTQFAMGIVSCIMAARAMSSSLPMRELVRAITIAAATVALATLVTMPWPVEAVLIAGVFGAALLLARVITVADFKRVLSRRAL